MNVQEFQNKLKEIQTIAKANGNSLTAIQIRDTFAGMELDKKQLLGVLKYLTSQEWKTVPQRKPKSRNERKSR